MRQIPLTKNLIALCDDEDYIRLSKNKWCASISKGNKPYALRRVTIDTGERKPILMHREIIGIPPMGKETDHINGNTVDNRKSNLRHVTARQNSQNRHTVMTSKLPGVYWDKKSQKWRSQIHINGKRKYLGLYNDETIAFNIYKNAVEQIGEMLIV